MTRRTIFALTLASVVESCAKKRPRATPAATARPGPSRLPGSPPVAIGATERGLASWYGHPYHGRPAADGEIYDMETLVAAHRTLPFQTMVRVRNLANDKSVDVRIIDRGPFVQGRIIDLSHAAAQVVDLIGPGVAQVEITVIEGAANPEPAVFAVQVGAFREKGNADRMERNMSAAYGFSKSVLRAGDPPMWRILAGRENTTETAETLARRIREEQRVPEAFVVRVDPDVASSVAPVRP